MQGLRPCSCGKEEENGSKEWRNGRNHRSIPGSLLWGAYVKELFGLEDASKIGAKIRRNSGKKLKTLWKMVKNKGAKLWKAGKKLFA